MNYNNEFTDTRSHMHHARPYEAKAYTHAIEHWGYLGWWANLSLFISPVLDVNTSLDQR